jgi:DNA-binding GntR family transcriptional regulator
VTDPRLAAIRAQPALRTRRVSADYIADAMRRAIVSGELADGEALSQASWAARFGVSRVPVREALRQLAAEGLVDTRAHRGAVVRALDPERIAELFALRGVLEGWLVELAGPRLDAAALAHAAELNERMLAELDHTRWLALNAEFHRSLTVPAEATETLELLGGLRRRAERYVRLWNRGRPVRRLDEAHAEHAEILSLLTAGRHAEARAAAERHVLKTCDRVVPTGEDPRPAASPSAPTQEDDR